VLTGRDQTLLASLTLCIIPLAMVPLELQRRLINEAIGRRDAHLLGMLALAWLGVLLLQGALKYVLNLRRGLVVEEVARDLRLRVHAQGPVGGSSGPESSGLLVSVVAAETEDVAGFVAESLSTPLLQAGTIVAVLGYLLWVQPLIALISLVVYLPELVFVPWQQQTLNRLRRLHTLVVRRMGRHLVRENLAPTRFSPADGFSRLVGYAFNTRIVSYRIKYGLTALGNLLDALGPLIILALGGWLVIQGQTSVGSLLVFITGLQKVGDPLDQLMTFYRTAQNARVTYGLIRIATTIKAPVTPP
jgi:ABC-type multidrug transport system fused ATPase/permease subunit